MNAQEYRDRKGEYRPDTPEGYALNVMNEIVAHVLETEGDEETERIMTGRLSGSLVLEMAGVWVSSHWDDMQYIAERDTLDYASCIMTIDTPYGPLEVTTRGHTPDSFDPCDILIAACDRAAWKEYEQDLRMHVEYAA